MLKFIKAFISGATAKEKRYIYITVTVLLITIFDRVVIGPFMSECGKLDKKIADQKEIVYKNMIILRYEDRIVDEVSIYSDYFIDDLSSRDELIACFLSEIEGYSKTAGTNLVNINPVESIDDVGYTQFVLAVGCEGNLKNLLDFFYNIESSKKLIRIIDFEISPKSRESQDVRCNLTISKLIITKPDTDSQDFT